MTGDGTIYTEPLRDEEQIRTLCVHILPNHLIQFFRIAEMRNEKAVLKVQLFPKGGNNASSKKANPKE